MSSCKIDWKQLLSTQAELDGYVFGVQKQTYEGTIKKRNLALIVELCECVNETKAFKFWSVRDGDRERTLDEYADVFHFILSNLIWRDLDPSSVVYKELPPKNKDELTDTFYDLIVTFDSSINGGTFVDWVQKFLDLGASLGFSFEEIHKAYMRKWSVNIERQKTGY